MNFKQYIQINESKKIVKQYVDAGKLDQSTADEIINIDPHPNKAFSGWIAKQYLDGKIENLLNAKNIITEWYNLSKRGQTKSKDIYQYKDINTMKEEVDILNAQGANVSKKQMKGDYDVLMDNENFFIAVPYTHAASRKLGLSEFACRENPQTGEKDSIWCTTYANDTNWNSYYYDEMITFYYIKVKNEQMVEKIINRLGDNFVNVALGVYPDSTPSKPHMFITESRDSNEYEQNSGQFIAFMEITNLHEI